MSTLAGQILDKYNTTMAEIDTQTELVFKTIESAGGQHEDWEGLVCNLQSQVETIRKLQVRRATLGELMT